MDFLDFVFKTKKISIWKKEENVSKKTEIKPVKSKKEEYKFYPKRLPVSRLTELSLIVDTGGVYTGESGLAELKEKDINFSPNL